MKFERQHHALNDEEKRKISSEIVRAFKCRFEGFSAEAKREIYNIVAEHPHVRAIHDESFEEEATVQTANFEECSIADDVDFQGKHAYCKNCQGPKCQSSHLHKDPKLLCDDDFLDEEWLRIWIYKRHQKEKIHLKGLRPEMYEECLLLYHKVYQGAPPNNEVDVHFTHGFTWLKCKGAKDSEGLVAWAMYAEGVIKMLRQKKTLNRKLEKWRSTNGPCLASEWKFNAENMPNYTDSTGTGFDWPPVHLGSDNSCVQLGECVACGMSIMQTVVTDVYMLRCQHLYHLLCFVTTCTSVDQCLFHGREEPLKDALKLLAPGEANMDEHVGTEKDPMEGIFGSPIDNIAHSQAGSSCKPNIDSMCGGCGDKNASEKQAAEVPLKPEPTMNKDVEDAEKSFEKPIEKDTTVNLSDEEADLLISDVCGEILGRRKKRSNTKECATPKRRAKAWYLSMEKLSWIGDVQEPDEKVEDIAAKQDADVTPDKVEEDQEPAVCPEIEEILPNCPG
ncbi:hypothetical protein L7F22_010273 [Adiantum nelumboides]|nr:hypothetical protein [Adiantum nelumboides]